MYDAPCKTIEDITFALTRRIRLNANSFNELEKIRCVVSQLERTDEKIVSALNVGVRINPLVGEGWCVCVCVYVYYV